MKLKVIFNDKTEKVVSFPNSESNSVVLRKYDQLVSQGDIYDFEIV